MTAAHATNSCAWQATLRLGADALTCLHLTEATEHVTEARTTFSEAPVQNLFVICFNYKTDARYAVGL